MIVVVGQPFARRGPAGWLADGPAVRVAAAVTELGNRVQLLGRIGEDPVGEALVLDCARRSIGHAALLRSPGHATPLLGGRPTEAEPLGLDAGDVELGLRYFVDLDAIVVADPLPVAALEVAARLAAAQEAVLVVAVERGEPVPAAVLAAHRDVIVLEAPGPEGRPAFDRFLGRLGARLAAGGSADAALRAAAEETGWRPATASARGPFLVAQD